MDPKLLWITRSGNVDALYSLIAKEPCLLKNLDVLPFIHTPLHEASSTGKTNLAMELIVLQPSFAKKLNTEGFSPLHLAVENHHSDLAKELILFDSTLVRTPGRGGMTPLHHVVTIGDLDLLAEFLVICPESIRDHLRMHCLLHLTVLISHFHDCGGSIKIKIEKSDRKRKKRERNFVYINEKSDEFVHLYY
ncbi:Ankyrin repeat family protein [Raphanus sativus]|uniref:Ankyrin repeat-containing protein BDA1-like n=1 Tax=Raphanus sativus TaxID=3726 RepID=A0A6J0KMB2_RAPSA|nr:ankyrin repeat-containing protein BDA1-like [Raphanus sativus]KAJ4875642.1 Ankyrin repeat family protein [Raphanus sativus]